MTEIEGHHLHALDVDNQGMQPETALHHIQSNKGLAMLNRRALMITAKKAIINNRKPHKEAIISKNSNSNKPLKEEMETPEEDKASIL